jgi:hypothetical protein
MREFPVMVRPNSTPLKGLIPVTQFYTPSALAARALGAWVAPTMVSAPGQPRRIRRERDRLGASIHRRLLALGAEVSQASALFAGLGAAAKLPENLPAAGQAIPAITRPAPG